MKEPFSILSRGKRIGNDSCCSRAKIVLHSIIELINLNLSHVLIIGVEAHDLVVNAADSQSRDRGSNLRQGDV